MKQTIALLLAIALTVSAGCSRMKKSDEGADKSDCSGITAPKGTLVGGAVGAGIGAIVAELAKEVTMSHGLGVGALAGGLIGSLIGNHKQVKCLEEEIDRLTRERDDLAARLKAAEDENAALKAEIEKLKARIAELERLLAECQASKELARASIPNSVLFASGSDKLTDAGKAVLDGVVDQMKRDYPGKPITIEGHTDSDPIRHSKWKSNWELGAARSLAVLHYLQDKHGITGAKLSALTYGEYKPVAANDSDANKALNRRSEIAVWAE